MLIIVLGVFGNILSFFIWTKGKRCSNNCGAIYLRMLALSDIAVLCIPAIELEVLFLNPALILRELNVVFCKIFPISVLFCVQISTWIVVCLTVEQTIVVCRPFDSLSRSGRWRHYRLVLIVTIVSFLDNLPIFFGYYWGVMSRRSSFEATVSPGGQDSNRTFDFTDSLEHSTIIQNHTSQNDSISEPSYTCVYAPISPWHTYIVRLGLISVGPVLILTTCNIIILVHLITRNKKLTAGDSRREGRSQSALVSVMTIRTVAISVVHCATTLPLVSLIICNLFHTNCYTVAQFLACNTIYYLNNSVNVLFYCVLGQNFRHDCASLFTKKPNVDFEPSRGNAAIKTVSTK